MLTPDVLPILCYQSGEIKPVISFPVPVLLLTERKLLLMLLPIWGKPVLNCELPVSSKVAGRGGWDITGSTPGV